MLLRNLAEGGKRRHTGIREHHIEPALLPLDVREEAIEMAQRAEVIVYTISTNITGMKQKGDKVLERIADATGGRAFFPFQIRDVANAFAEIQDELRSQYALSYKPADFRADGRYRTIEIMAMDKKNLRVRARRGYFAPVQ